MSEFQAPKEYTPEYCTSVYDRMHSALTAAINAFTLASSGQKDLTRQAIKHLESSFTKTETTLEKNKTSQTDFIKEHEKSHKQAREDHIADHEKLDQKINKLKNQFYAGGIAALVFLIGVIFAILKIIQSTPTPGPG